ncbi:MAG: hypothetical protein EOO75_03530 [Myxococcales bacterium]|nr:MAG: hypothetical protein EOO75_03530 [Myxococcales bacterium]
MATTTTAMTAGATATTAAPTGAAVPRTVASAAAGANVTMASSTVDGLKAKDLSCRAGGGLFAGPTILGGLSKQRTALQGCAKAGEDARVQFDMDGSKLTDVRVAASGPAVARCVADALGQVTVSDRGQCVVTLRVGPD